MRKNNMKYKLIIGLCLLGLLINIAHAARIKDLASVAGVRSNQLIGYGLVVGLDGSGDRTAQTPFTVQSLKSMLNQFGITMSPDLNPRLKNVAAVSIQATLPAFAKPGQKIDVTVSSIGNAKSLRGGSLLLSPLKGADGKIYALAQGNLVVSGLGAEGDGSRVTVNIPSTGRIPNGAMVERGVPDGFHNGSSILLNLHTADFTTAHRLAEEINKSFGNATSRALDGVTIQVSAPQDPTQRVSFVSMLENLNVDPGSSAAKVIINSRTGTVVISSNVTVTPAAVTHGSMTVRITENPVVKQPNPLAEGETAVIPATNIQIEQERNRMFKFAPGVSLDRIVNAVNEVGAAPGDLVAILEALKEAGALRAELIII